MAAGSWGVLVIVSLAFVCPSSPSICDYSQCNCSNIGGVWINAVCAFNNTQRQLDIGVDQLPRRLAELSVSGPRELVLLADAFSRNLSGLSLVNLTDVGVITVQRRAFARLSHPHLLLEISGAQRVIMESHAFHETRGTVSARVSRVDRLIVQEQAFERLLELEISGVSQLELQPKAFFYTPDKKEVQGPATKITLDSVRMRELPASAFPALNQLTVVRSEVGLVRASAFRAITLQSIHLVNSTFGEFEGDAFESRSAIGQLRLDSVRVGRVHPMAVQSGITRLAVRGCSFGEVSESAFNTVSGSVTISDNVFDRVRARGFTLKDATTVTVEGNRFNALDDAAFALSDGDSGVRAAVAFRRNSLGEALGRAVVDLEPAADVADNAFDRPCRCEADAKRWLEERFGPSEPVVDRLYDTGLCRVTGDLARCFALTAGAHPMANFSAEACGDRAEFYCPDAPAEEERPDGPGAAEGEAGGDPAAAERERALLGSVAAFAVCGVLLTLALSGAAWLRRRGYCTKARLMLVSVDSLLDAASRAFAGAGSGAAGGAAAAAAGAGTGGGHEYAELRKPPEDEPWVEDRATQTLPEELTQELLQSLREKLDDPDNYGEARDMIEHLYDLIKVEESCNRNSDSISIRVEDEDEDATTAPAPGENLYDEIRPKGRARTRPGAGSRGRSLVSVGTRAPSPDKLLPLTLTRRPRPALCEYTEPRDLQPHVYQELPGADVALAPLANRPLPSAPEPPLDPAVIQ